jgi:CRISPR-associated endonuclease/helicase Cas3
MHSVAWHGLDVAACFLEILRNWPEQQTAIEQAFVEPSDKIVPALLSLVALHDVGKFAWTFQAKVEDAYPGCLGGWKTPPAARHDQIGFALAESEMHLADAIGALFADNDAQRLPILGAVFGHHGQPIDHSVASGKADLSKHMGRMSEPASLAARAFTDAVIELFRRPSLPLLRSNGERSLSWRLAGLIALADWLGSDQGHFHYESANWQLPEYWRQIAQPRAAAAFAASGLSPVGLNTEPISSAVISSNLSLTDAQRWAANVPLATPGGLFIIEDVMGSGKTEAALILAQRLMQAGQASGLYLALPTMATANALYRRMAQSYRRLFLRDANPSLILAHGARELDTAFTGSIGLGLCESITDKYDSNDESGSAACARWISDDRRKAFLADVGVGTIDQALLAILPVKHACIRQTGLARRVLIIDEAHAYDAYVQRELETLLEHQARLGVPVIILSATLPRSIRQRLVSAHARGRGATVPQLSSNAYPLATVIGQTATEETIAAREDLCRQVSIRRCSKPEDAEASAIAAAHAGAAVAYIRNTVDDAIATYNRLCAKWDSVDLFHARFAMCDRLDVEERIVKRFGRHGTQEDRRGKILVATQVVEQSIDLDFDLLITDLAPIDLVLQRLGRMWRHKRAGRCWPRPEVFVVSPEPTIDASEAWYAEAFPKAKWVYRDHAVLWLTASRLFAKKMLLVPEDMRELVEAVYNNEALDSAPKALHRASLEAQGRAIASRATAALNVLQFADGYVTKSGAWGPDTVTPTREGEERVLLRLCKWEKGRLRPYADNCDQNRAWQLSEVSVRKGRFTKRAGLPGEIEAAAAELDAQWAERNIFAKAIPMTPGRIWTLPIASNQKGVRRATYSQETGLHWADVS